MRNALRPPPISAVSLKRYVRIVLSLLPATSADLRIRIVGDRAIARFNREFLGRDFPTNVLSFPESEPGKGTGPVPVAGDIVVSAPTCLRQTREWNDSPEERIFYFVLHGILHLAGYDHVQGGGAARRMRRRESSLFRRVLASGRETCGQ